MKKLYFAIFAFIMIMSSAKAQINYNFTAVTGTYTAISGGNSATLVEADSIGGLTNTDEGYSNAIPIGFNFNYNGTVYSAISANTNGFAAFDTFLPITNDTTQAYYFDDLANGAYGPTIIRPILAPLWDDLDLSSATDLKYATTGTAPNQVFTLEWNNVLWEYDATAPVISFQLKLYEGTNVIEFHYMQLSGAPSFPEASIGISEAATGANNFLSLNNSTAAPIASSTISTDTIATKPATGQIYRFTPLAATPVLLSSFTGERKNNSINVLSWLVLTEQDNKGFMLQRSSDGIKFEDIGFVATNAPGGNSSSPLNYSFEDVRPLANSNFYRLQQINKDGKVTYSKIILINGLQLSKLSLRYIYPNPAINTLKLVIDAPASERIIINVTDITGKTLIQQRSQVLNGTNTVPINVSKLSAGEYILNVLYGAAKKGITSKFVKR